MDHLDEGGAELGGGSPTQKIQSPTINTSSIPVIKLYHTVMINPHLIVFSSPLTVITTIVK